jgi:alkaline phosphatase
MKYRFTALVGLFLMALSIMAEGQAKYVFYFIGDGMGVNQVNVSETYLGALEGRIGTVDMCFPSFPFAGVATTHSANSGVTDSAAGGTALATGHKTVNGTLGMKADKKEAVQSVAVWAQDAGAAVGITTSVSVDHATPASFYAHVPNRSEYYKVGLQMIESKFDFFGGSDLLKPKNPTEGGPDLYAQCQSAGYTIARGYKEYQKKCKKADKMILLQTEEASKIDRGSIPYAIDRQKGDMTLTEITRAAINFLTKKQAEKNGFFLMVEGGKIDWVCHANDAKAVIQETIDMDEAVKVAYEFYEQHPDETLIVVTADHETGGISLGRGPYELHLDQLRHQQISVNKLGSDLHKMHQKYGEKYSWDLVKKYLTDNFGLWEQIKLSDEQNKRLENAFQNIMAGKGKDDKTLYQKDDELATAVKHIMSEVALVGWTSGSHSGGYVPVFAIGAGAENFTGRMDNTEVPLRIAKATGWKVR